MSETENESEVVIDVMVSCAKKIQYNTFESLKSSN